MNDGRYVLASVISRACVISLSSSSVSAWFSGDEFKYGSRASTDLNLEQRHDRLILRPLRGNFISQILPGLELRCFVNASRSSRGYRTDVSFIIACSIVTFRRSWILRLFQVVEPPGFTTSNLLELEVDWSVNRSASAPTSFFIPSSSRVTS